MDALRNIHEGRMSDADAEARRVDASERGLDPRVELGLSAEEWTAYCHGLPL